MGITIERKGGSFVAEIDGLDLSNPLSNADWSTLHSAYLDHKALVFHGQNLDAPSLAQFGEMFGGISPHTVRKYRHEDIKGVTILSNRVEMGRPKGIRDAGSHWHSDYSYREIPANVTILYALETPDEGGDTILCNMQAAWETLPEATKIRLDGLQHLLQYRWCANQNHPESRWCLLSEDERHETPEVTHPVVRTHPETGAKSLYVFSGLTSGVQRILGIPDDESRALLGDIFTHCENSKFHYRYKWQGPGDILLWDNRCTMHHATTDRLPADKPRTLWRINTIGDKPI